MTPTGHSAVPLRAVVFDWGGTLTPWHSVDLGEQWRVFAREIHGVRIDGPDVSDEDVAAAHELADRILAAEDRAWARGRTEHTSAGIDEILADAGADPTHDRHLLALAAYRRFWEPHTITDPQVLPLWEGLRARGLRIGVLSNTIWSREFHREIFERDSVLDLIDEDIYSSEIEYVKPHPQAFREICRRLGVQPREAAYVGDRIFEDVHGPQQAGMRAIWIPHSDIPADQRVEVTAIPDAHAHELLDILAIVDDWLAR